MHYDSFFFAFFPALLFSSRFIYCNLSLIFFSPFFARDPPSTVCRISHLLSSMFIFDVHDVFAFVEYRYHGRATVAKDGADLPAGAVRSCKLPQNLVDTAGACSSNDPRTMRGSRGAPLSVCSLSRGCTLSIDFMLTSAITMTSFIEGNASGRCPRLWFRHSIERRQQQVETD